jgi:hypothetical protein
MIPKKRVGLDPGPERAFGKIMLERLNAAIK